MRLFADSIGRKAVMAVTGMLMVLFVVMHLLGNLSIFAGPNGINTYAEKLHALGPVVWILRLVMAAAVVLHVILSIQITLENSAAKPQKYAVAKSLRATFASKSMIWTGLIVGAFIGYHLLHFTFRVTPGLALGEDAVGRFDVFTMVVSAFSSAAIALVYVVSMVALFLHLSHGIQSTFQTLGLSNGKLLPAYDRWGKVASACFLIGYGAIPVLVIVGLLAK
jgi:succinate dehydrogenase / fumarate reductase, cytochrome b subunit